MSARVPSAPPLRCSEREWQSFVTDCLDLGGFRWYHTHDSRRSPSGFPDLIAVKDGQVLALELKAETGRTTEEQKAWLLALAKVPGVRAGVLRPSAWCDVLTLTGVSELGDVG